MTETASTAKWTKVRGGDPPSPFVPLYLRGDFGEGVGRFCNDIDGCTWYELYSKIDGKWLKSDLISDFFIPEEWAYIK